MKTTGSAQLVRALPPTVAGAGLGCEVGTRPGADRQRVVQLMHVLVGGDEDDVLVARVGLAGQWTAGRCRRAASNYRQVVDRPAAVNCAVPNLRRHHHPPSVARRTVPSSWSRLAPIAKMTADDAGALVRFARVLGDVRWANRGIAAALVARRRQSAMAATNAPAV